MVGVTEDLLARKFARGVDFKFVGHSSFSKGQSSTELLCGLIFPIIAIIAFISVVRYNGSRNRY
jgi:hypothetical protein